MARNWIKIETATTDKPEVCAVATQLKMDPDAVLGKLVRLWSWAEVNRINGNDISVTREFLDKVVGKKGFAKALEGAGWLKEDAGGKLCFPNFGRHNGPAGKGRALTALRVSRHRERQRKRNEDESESAPAIATSPQDNGVTQTTVDVSKKAPRKEVDKSLVKNQKTKEITQLDESIAPTPEPEQASSSSGEFVASYGEIAGMQRFDDVADSDASAEVDEAAFEESNPEDATLSSNEMESEISSKPNDPEPVPTEAPKEKKSKSGSSSRKSQSGDSPDQPLLF